MNLKAQKWVDEEKGGLRPTPERLIGSSAYGAVTEGRFSGGYRACDNCQGRSSKISKKMV